MPELIVVDNTGIGELLGEERARSNAEWRRWGEADPFWAVSSWEGRERGGARPWTPTDFYALGESDWSDFRGRLSNYGANFGVALEVGCGAGRLTKSMGTDFRNVIGVDVSPGMIATARRYVQDPNIDFRISDGLILPTADGTVDVVVSTHVFQHFDNLEIARSNFAEIVRVLADGGVMLVHLPIYQYPVHGIPLAELWLKGQKAARDARAMLYRRRGRPLMRRLAFSRDWIFSELSSLGLRDVEIQTFRVRSNDGVHDCVLGRR